MTLDPRVYSKEEIRQHWAILPEWRNTMDYIVTGMVDPHYIMDRGPTAPQTSSNGRTYPGGMEEVLIMNPNVAVEVFYAGRSYLRE